MPVQGSIVIGGGAFAGLALALALRQGLGPEIPVIVADPALATRPSRDPRAPRPPPRPPPTRARAPLAAPLRGDRCLGRRQGRGAADPRHGRRRFQAGG